MKYARILPLRYFRRAVAPRSPLHTDDQIAAVGYTFPMRVALSLAATLLCLPFVALAANAGFAPGTLWLSSSAAEAGDTVTVYSVVYDSTANPLEGDVAFTVDGTPLSTQHFKLAAGETQIVSTGWTAVEGTHSFSASLKNATGVDGSLATATTNTASISVAKAPPGVIEQYAAKANEAIGSTSPALASVLSSAIAQTENWRASGADFLNKALYTDQASAGAGTSTTGAPKRAVLGAETYRAPVDATAKPATSFFAQAKQLLLMMLLWIFRSAYLFYPFFALIVFILLYIAKRTLTRPSY